MERTVALYLGGQNALSWALARFVAVAVLWAGDADVTASTVLAERRALVGLANLLRSWAWNGPSRSRSCGPWARPPDWCEPGVLGMAAVVNGQAAIQLRIPCLALAMLPAAIVAGRGLASVLPARHAARIAPAAGLVPA